MARTKSEVSGYEKQFAVVRSLPRLEQSETLQFLQRLASLEQGSPEWTALRNAITEGNLYFAYTVGNAYALRFQMIADDCIQLASLGLLKAVEDYTKNGNGQSFLPYAKTAICNVIRRKGISPALKCGITNSRDENNKSHNAQTDAKRQEKGKSAIESVSVVGDEQTDENGNKRSVLESVPAESKDAFTELSEKEMRELYETAVNAVLKGTDAEIWRLREQGLEWSAIAEKVGLKRNATQMRFYSAKERVQAYLASII